MIHLEHIGSFDQTVSIAAKVNLSGMDINNLVFYSYDSTTNTFQRIYTEYYVDGNGYLCFTTDVGGDIIVSDGSLN